MMKNPSATKMRQRLAAMARRPAEKGYVTLLENCENKDIPPTSEIDDTKLDQQQQDKAAESAASFIGSHSSAYDLSTIMSATEFTTESSDNAAWATPMKSRSDETEYVSSASSSSSSNEGSPVARSPDEEFFAQSLNNPFLDTLNKTSLSSADDPSSTEQSTIQNDNNNTTLDESIRKAPFFVTQFSSETFQKAYDKVCQYEQELLASQSFSTLHLTDAQNNSNISTTSSDQLSSFNESNNNTKDRLCLDATFLDLTRTASNESEEIVLRETTNGIHPSDDTTYTRKDPSLVRYRLDLEKMAIFRFSSVATNELVDLILQKISHVEPITSEAETRRAIMVVGESRTGQAQNITLVPFEQGTSFIWMLAIQRALSMFRPKLYHMDESFNEPHCDPHEGWIIMECDASPDHHDVDKGNAHQTDSVQQWVDLARLSENASEGRDLVINQIVMEKASIVFFGKGPSFASSSKLDDLVVKPVGDEAAAGDKTATQAYDEVVYPKAIVERHQVNKLSWTFYRNMCLLLQARMRYEEAYRRIQLDPIYPYLTSITGLADSGGEGQSSKNTHKEIQQHQLPEFRKISRVDVAERLIEQAEEAMPELVKLCEKLAKIMHFEDARLGPIKDMRTALAKADLKYGGNILKVTDFCRVSLVVKDLPTLLALIECMEQTCSNSIRRVKLSSLKGEKAKKGGYRDCIVNLEVAKHLCEIQVHLLPMWMIGGMGGYVHYQNCRKHSIDNFDNPYKMLDRLDIQTQSEIMIIAEEALSETQIDSLGSTDERVLLDCFAQAGLFVRAGLLKWAEMIFRKLIEAFSNVPHLGPNHPETIMIYNRLIDTLWAQEEHEEISHLQAHVEAYQQSRTQELQSAKHSLWEYFVYDMIVDPSREDRETDEVYRREIKASKRIWKQMREEKYSFLLESSTKRQ